MSVYLHPQILIEPRKSPFGDGHELNLSNVSTPSEVVQEDGYFIESYSVQLNYVESPPGVELVLSRYYPTNALSIGFDRFYLIDKNTHKPVVMNDLIVKHIEKFSFENFSGFVRIDNEHRFRGLSGHLDDRLVIKVSCVIFQTYDLWKEFPNEKSMDDVKTMIEARSSAIANMRNIESTESEIKEFRDQIEETKHLISESESALNKEYEKLASNVEVLESRGYKFDFNEENKRMNFTYEGLQIGKYITASALSCPESLYSGVNLSRPPFDAVSYN